MPLSLLLHDSWGAFIQLGIEKNLSGCFDLEARNSFSSNVGAVIASEDRRASFSISEKYSQ
jgi:hypothetical protein